MRIALITFQNGINYGAVLQCYSLLQVLKNLGHSVEVIDYHRLPPPYSKFKSFSFFASFRLAGRVIKKKCQKYSGLKVQKVFDSFVEGHFPLTSKRYVGYEDLHRNPPKADAYICGSDQIWNDRFWNGYDAAYFLNFGSPQTRRIAYAPGVPGRKFAKGNAESFKKLVSEIEFISAREEIGQSLIEETTGKKVPIVLDPTLLYGEFDNVLEPVQVPRAFCLEYCLPTDDFQRDRLKRFLKIQAKCRSLPIVSVSLRRNLLGKDRIFSPFQWLWLIKNSSLFITNSYHGLIFCLIFRKVFFVLPRDGSPSGQDARMLYILRKYGLMDRFISSPDSFSDPSEIDWEKVALLIEQDKNNSMSYLRDALK